mmetsp:Transcript_13412/g.24009  ORF Transcript_13412/g.24009 Transcript_13412/m.24009 type:complete len:280 (-) Transcript_13412:22-861(-)
MTMFAPRLSKLEVGSSQKSTEGFADSSTPIVKRLACSVVRVLVCRSRIDSSSSVAAISSTKRLFSWSGTISDCRSLALKSIASCTVALGLCMSICSTYPVIREKEISSLARPLTNISPSTFPLVLRPAITSKSVVFPAPLLPISAVIVPAFAYPEILSNNWILFFPTKYERFRNFKLTREKLFLTTSLDCGTFTVILILESCIFSSTAALELGLAVCIVVYTYMDAIVAKIRYNIWTPMAPQIYSTCLPRRLSNENRRKATSCCSSFHPLLENTTKAMP